MNVIIQLDLGVIFETLYLRLGRNGIFYKVPAAILETRVNSRHMDGTSWDPSGFSYGFLRHKFIHSRLGWSNLNSSRKSIGILTAIIRPIFWFDQVNKKRFRGGAFSHNKYSKLAKLFLDLTQTPWSKVPIKTGFQPQHVVHSVSSLQQRKIVKVVIKIDFNLKILNYVEFVSGLLNGTFGGQQPFPLWILHVRYKKWAEKVHYVARVDDEDIIFFHLLPKIAYRHLFSIIHTS